MIEKNVLNRIANDSKEFFCENGDVTKFHIRNYWNRDYEIVIDLTKLTPEIYEEIKADEEEEEE